VIPVEAWAGGIASAILIGAFAGLMPAVRASRMPPTVCCERHEREVDLYRGRRALARVPEPFRSTLVIVDVEDQSYESAAEALGVPIGTVRSRLFRGRRLMQEHLQTFGADAGLCC